jgi:hypothetical protein
MISLRREVSQKNRKKEIIFPIRNQVLLFKEPRTGSGGGFYPRL